MPIAGPLGRSLVQVVTMPKRSLPKKHLVAQEMEGPTGGPVDFAASPTFSVIVGQYVVGGEEDSEQMGGMVGLDSKYGLDKPIELNETAWYPTWYRNTTRLRRRVWKPGSSWWAAAPALII